MAEVKMDTKEKQIVDIIRTADRKPAEKIVTSVTEHKGLVKMGSDFGKEVLRPIMGNAVLEILRTLLLSGADAAINFASCKIFGQPTGRTMGGFNTINGFNGMFNYNAISNISKPISLRGNNAVGMYQTNTGMSIGYSVKELKFINKGEAEAVRDDIIEYIDLYQAAEVARLYQLCGLPASPQDFKYGWTSFASSEIRKALDGTFILICPKPVIIN